ncbi:MAG TPA: hypothetical protein VD794_02850 [Flavisolibacter sp.]|nr:hypothetical protein [Flavisolibacter sp.]
MKKFATKTFCLLVIAALGFTSCKKDQDDHSSGGGTPNPIPTAKYLDVTVNEYLPTGKIDSALVIWEVNGTTQTLKMPWSQNQFRLPLASLNNNGSGTLTIQLYSQVKVGDKPLQWEHRMPYTLNKLQGLVIAAPTSIRDQAWSPRVIFNYDNSMGSRFSAIIALRPEDAYFELKGVAPVYAKRIEIVRSFHQKAANITAFSRGWVGQYTNLDSKGNLLDRQHFLALPEQIGDKEWDEYRIRASFFLNSDPAMTYQFHLELDRR